MIEIEDKNKNRKSKKGSLTVEAILFLIPFMCAFFTLINGARFVQAEMIIHHAITQTAKQISTYSYVLTKSKISEKMQDTNRKSEQFKASVDSAISSVQGFVDAVGNVGNNPQAVVSGVFSLAKSEGRGAGMAVAVGTIAENSIKNAIVQISDNPDEFLTELGIIDGIAGLDFSESKWISNEDGKADIQIIVTYKMKNLLFPDFDFGQYEFVQCASTLTW